MGRTPGGRSSEQHMTLQSLQSKRTGLHLPWRCPLPPAAVSRTRAGLPGLGQGLPSMAPILGLSLQKEKLAQTPGSSPLQDKRPLPTHPAPLADSPGPSTWRSSFTFSGAKGSGVWLRDSLDSGCLSAGELAGTGSSGQDCRVP